MNILVVRVRLAEIINYVLVLQSARALVRTSNYRRFQEFFCRELFGCFGARIMNEQTLRLFKRKSWISWIHGKARHAYP